MTPTNPDRAALLARLDALLAANPGDGWTWTAETPEVEIVYRDLPSFRPLYAFPRAHWRLRVR